MGGSAATHRLVKVPREELASWDATHDAAGRLLNLRDEKKGLKGEVEAEKGGEDMLKV